MQELRDKAVYYQKSGMVSVWDCDTAVVKSDVLVPARLAESLQDAVRSLENVPEKQKNWHPGSGKKVLDLLDPSLFPLIYGQSRVLPSGTVPLEDCSRFTGEGGLVDPPLEDNYRFYHAVWFNAWGSFQWLPSNVSFAENGSPRLTSYINNLHPQMHSDLYGILEQLVKCSMPLWNECLSWFQRRLRIQRVAGSIHNFTLPEGVKYYPPRDRASDSEDKEDGLSLEQVEERGFFLDEDFNSWFSRHLVLIQREPNAFISRERSESQPDHHPLHLQKDFRSSGLQIVFKLANIHLTPENPRYAGVPWHIEGALNEHICATALYFYDEQNITNAALPSASL